MRTLPDYFWFATAVALIWLTGRSIRTLCRQARSTFLDVCLDLVMGIIAVSLWCLALLLAGVQPTRPLLGLLPLAGLGAMLVARVHSRPASDPPDQGRALPGKGLSPITLLLYTLAFCLTVWQGWLALSHTVGSAAGMAIWGFKAKLFFLEGRIDPGFFTDPTRIFAQQSYPLCFPLLIVWCYGWLGHVNDHVIQLLPVLFAGGSLFLLLQLLLSRGTRLWPLCLAALGLYASSSFAATIDNLYAEPLLVFFALTGIAAIRAKRHAKDGTFPQEAWFVLGSCAWIKNEGLLIVLCAMGSAWLLNPRRPPLPAFGAALCAALPWLIAQLALKPPLTDFNPAAPRWDALQAAFQRFADFTIRDFLHFNALWPVFMVLVPLSLPALRRSPKTALTTVLALSLAIVFCLIFTFSAVPELDWHLNAMDRLLFVPTVLVVLVLGDLLAPERVAA